MVPLYECGGRVRSVPAFAEENLRLLQPHERQLVVQMLTRLSGAGNIPEPLRRCLSRSQEFATCPTPALVARRGGARSAFWVEQRLKFKGCRPGRDGASYPIETLSFGTTRIHRGRIRFGILSREAVMREILGYCFFRIHELAPHATPLCVYEYVADGRTHGCCLVMKTVGETRVEDFIDYPEITVGELKAAVTGGRAADRYVLGSELRLRGLNLWWYVETKSRLLLSMHTHGGFRGILNSNLGNDVVVGFDNLPLSLYLCDFDTFKTVVMPSRPDARFLRSFMLHCLIEVVKGSISILDYLDLPETLKPAERAEALAQVYLEKSSLWQAYRRRFAAHARAEQWDYGLLEPAFRSAVRTGAMAHVLGGCVLNNHYLQEVERNRGIYYPHS